VTESPSPDHDSHSDGPHDVNDRSAQAADGSERLRLAMVIVAMLIVSAGAVAFMMNGRDGASDPGIDETVTTGGSIEVTARLIEIRGQFLPNDNLYNYAFVMKYEVLEVHRGQLDAKELVVAHYNPLKPRPTVADEFYPDVGGSLKQFRDGDTHRMALEVPLDDYYIGGIIDRYFQEKKGPIYWGLWTNQVK
jgi:hypothetical protein